MARRDRQPIPHPTDPSIALVPLTKGHFAIISAVDVAAVSRYAWHTVEKGPRSRGLYAGRKDRHVDVHVRSLHRFIASEAGIDVSLEVDHLNGNGLDCRRSNLRPANRRQQSCNTSRRSDNTSGVKGVGWDRVNEKWRAKIKAGGKFICLGRFATIEEAAEARRLASLALHGEFSELHREAAKA